MSNPTLQERVAEFTYRCGRVTAVPLDPEVLRRGNRIVVLEDHRDGSQKAFRYLPSEVELDALGARARPLFLVKDRCNWSAGCGALRRLVEKSKVEGAKGDADAVKKLQAHWNELNPAKHPRYQMTRWLNGALPFVLGSWSDSEMADSWLNGDTVHADHGRQHVATRDERRIAAWLRHLRIIHLAATTVEFVRRLDDRLALGVPAWAFDFADLPGGPVRVGVDGLEVWSAPVDAASPEDLEAARQGQDLDATRWTKLSDGFEA